MDFLRGIYLQDVENDNDKLNKKDGEKNRNPKTVSHTYRYRKSANKLNES